MSFREEVGRGCALRIQQQPWRVLETTLNNSLIWQLHTAYFRGVGHAGCGTENSESVPIHCIPCRTRTEEGVLLS